MVEDDKSVSDSEGATPVYKTSVSKDNITTCNYGVLVEVAT